MATPHEPPGTGPEWPALPSPEAWGEGLATLHMWTQVVGKVRLALAPELNHWWHVVLYPTARGLTTSPMPHGDGTVQIDFDLRDHRLVVESDRGDARAMDLASLSVAGFHRRTMDALRGMGVDVSIWPVPVEVEEAIPFERDDRAGYDPDATERFHRALLAMTPVLESFRGRFVGKTSPVHFFWGAFDLAVTRFSGRTAPPHPGGFPNVGIEVMREAYSHEVSSAGFWPGGGGIDEPSFYAYAYPEPEGFREAPVEPDAAFYLDAMGEFVLPYDAVRTADDPAGTLFRFLRTTYDAAADAAGWDRSALERG